MSCFRLPQTGTSPAGLLNCVHTQINPLCRQLQRADRLENASHVVNGCAGAVTRAERPQISSHSFHSSPHVTLVVCLEFNQYKAFQK